MEILPGPVLRFHVYQEQREEQIAELLQTCERLGIREVALFTADYICGEVFPTMEGLQARLDHLNICAERIRRAGLVFSLNVMHTLGHLYVPQQDIDRFGFSRQVDADGQPGKHPILDPACPKLREHLAETFRLYAQLRSRLMFVDDDYAVPLEQCYLPQRLKRFSEEFDCNAAPKTIQGLLASPDGTTPHRAISLMTRLASEDLTTLAEILRTAVHSVEPGTRLGQMFSGQVPPAAIIGVARALAGPHQPFVRPQIPPYREEAPLTYYPRMFWEIEVWKSRLPADFEFYPECENYPYYTSLKSPAAAYAHFSSILGAGEPRVALSLNSFATIVPACESRELVDYFAASKGQVRAVVNELAAAGELQGPGVCVDGGLDLLQLKGVPLRCAAPDEALIQWGVGLNSLSDEAIARRLKRGAILDLRSATILHDRGVLKLTGLELQERCSLDDLMHIAFPRRDGGI
ncbi:MAG: hypothetical protein KKD33_02325, partial [Verrucomicrobia bacterium]|nr:hypothetical protein [Verrucomicrobiota bacterium]